MSLINFKFDIDDKVQWKNPHDVHQRTQEGVITAQVRRKRMYSGISMEYYANFREDPFMNIVCNEEDLLPVNGSAGEHGNPCRKPNCNCPGS